MTGAVRGSLLLLLWFRACHSAIQTTLPNGSWLLLSHDKMRTPWYLRQDTNILMELRGGAAAAAEEDEKTSKISSNTRRRHNGENSSSETDSATGKKKKKRKSTAAKKTDEEASRKSSRQQEGGKVEISESTSQSKKQIQKAMKPSGASKTGDAVADAMAQAILDRAHILRNDPPLLNTAHHHDPSTTPYYDVSIHSIGHGMGMTPLPTTNTHPSSSSRDESTRRHQHKRSTSDASMTVEENILLEGMDNDDLVGMEDVRSAILANYIFQSHGGTHLLQTLASAVASLTGISACVFAFGPNPKTIADAASASPTTAASMVACYLLFKQCAVMGMIKHGMGLIGMVLLSAKHIPQQGLYQTRQVVERLIQSREDGAVSRYLFYCSWLVLWTALGVNNIDGSTVPWWMSCDLPPMWRGITVVCLLGPILLREVIHILWTASDVLSILASYSSSSSNRKDGVATLSKAILAVSAAGVDQIMNPIVRWTPGTTSHDDTTSTNLQPWTESDAITRQRLLARGVTKLSSVLELYTAVLVGFDVASNCLEFVGISPVTMWMSLFGIATSESSQPRPSLSKVVKSVICARLYLNFLLFHGGGSKHKAKKGKERTASIW
jgi:hypothetical protein